MGRWVRRAGAFGCWGLLVGCMGNPGPPPGLVTVDLVPAVGGARLEEPEVAVRLAPAGGDATWTPQHPAVFAGIAPNEDLAVTLPERFLVAPHDASADRHRADARGRAALEIPVLRWVSLTTITERRDPESELARVLSVDTTRPDYWLFEWREEHLVFRRRPVPRTLAALATAATAEWKEHGNHRAPGDRRRDLAVLLVGPDQAAADIVRIAEAMATPRREQVVIHRRPEADEDYGRGRGRGEESGYEVHGVSAFEIVLAHGPEDRDFPVMGHAGPKGSVQPGDGKLTLRRAFTSGCQGVRAAAMFQRVDPQARGCYLAALAVDPRLSGVFTASVTLGADGRVGVVSRPVLHEPSAVPGGDTHLDATLALPGHPSRAAVALAACLSDTLHLLTTEPAERSCRIEVTLDLVAPVAAEGKR